MKWWKHRLERNYLNKSSREISLAWLKCYRNRKFGSNIWTRMPIRHFCTHAIWDDIHSLNISPSVVLISSALTFSVIFFLFHENIYTNFPSQTSLATTSTYFLLKSHYFAGQNALALATYSGDQKTCEYLVHMRSFEAYNRSSICSPLCVAVITENIELVKYFLKLEYAGVTAKFQCQSGTIHGLCPLKLAMLQRHKQIIDTLRPTHAHHFIH